jgi:RNA polymerase sigma-70 factor (sigma-E family)
VRAEQRDREFEEFVAGAWPRLRRAAYLLCHDTHEADDLVQSALATCYVRWPKVRRDDAFAYVRRALVNAYIDTTRRRRPVPVATDPDRGVDPDHSVEDRSELTDLLAPLSPRERSIIVWRYYLDAPEAEVAERLGVSRGTVKSTASRALARLRSAATTEGENR